MDYLINSRNSASEMILIPIFSALVTFEAPGLAPAIKAVVFLVTELVTVAPFSRNKSSASSRPKSVSVPVTTKL